MSQNNMNMPANAREQLIAMLYGEMLTQQERMESMQTRIENNTKELQILSSTSGSAMKYYLMIFVFIIGAAFGTFIIA